MRLCINNLFISIFFINLLIYSFSDILWVIFSIVVFTSLWAIYYLYINYITANTVLAVDVKAVKITNVNQNIRVTYWIVVCLWFTMLNYIIIQKFYSCTIFWDILYLSNNNIFYNFFVTFILITIILCVYNIQKYNLSFSAEYILFICLIIFLSYLLISSTNLLFTIFMLELIALLIFAKFTVSKLLNKYNPVIHANNMSTYLTQFSYGLFNSLFFQFWANFISSVFLFFALINVHYSFGTSNFFIVNFLNSVILSSWYSPVSVIMCIFMIFIIGLFIKLGLSPYQFFKIETYKGIPLYMIVVYTVLYLIIYIYFFIYLIIYQLPTVREITNVYILLFVILSLIYAFSLLFDTKNFKAFLSYSTLITVINLFVVVLTI